MIKRIVLILVFILVTNIPIGNTTDDVFSVQSDPIQNTIALFSSSIVQSLPASIISRSDGRTPTALLITCEDANIRWCVGGKVPNRGTPRGHILYARQSLRIVNTSWITTFQYISASSGIVATLQVTAEYSN